MEEIIGSKYRRFHLKRVQARIRNQLKPSTRRQPTVYLLVTEDDQRFKLLCVKDSENIHFKQIKENQRWLEVAAFVPKLIWQDRHNILIEFIEGRFPDVASEQFAKAYAENLVQVHAMDTSAIRSEVFITNVERDLESFVTREYLDRQSVDGIIRHLKAIAPDKIRTSMVYADQNRDNFVVGQDSQLYLIDLGSFQRKRATGEFLAGGALFEQMDQESFKEVYLAAGGSEFIFRNREFLRYANLVRNGVGHLRRYLEVPFFDIRLRRARLRNVERVVRMLKSVA